MSITNLRVGTRLAVGFALVLLMMVALAITGLVRMSTMQATLNSIVNVENVKVGHIVAMRQSVMEAILNARNVALMTEQQDIAAETVRLEENRAVYKRRFELLDGMVASGGERAALDKIVATRAASINVVKKMSDLTAAGDKAGSVRVLLKELQPLQRKTLDAMDEMVAYEEQQMQLAVRQAEDAHASSRTQSLVFMALAAVFGAALAWVITDSLIRQMGGEPKYAAEIASKIAQGELCVPIDIKPDDQASLLFAMRAMRDRLAMMVGDVRSATQNIAEASSEIATGNLDLSRRTDQQASALEETASSMEQLTSVVRQNTGNARHGNNLARSASEAAAHGGVVVTRVIDTMGAINASARKIVDIISVIDGIAFQTNILALNAAVEAARAGEQGRGFAVVAGEVRNLAQRSAAAAKEVKQLIDNSVAEVETGSKLVDEAGAAMASVVASIGRVTDIMGEIAVASEEQSEGIGQVNHAVTEMDGVTQQNAALVEEAAAAAQSMQQQSVRLAEIVSLFRLQEAPSKPPALTLVYGG
ncbi:methyl-accepting chemotaxis protein [Pseudoduganella sp. FT26W]|uniref:Methyl-accepting chemotaxis protein n=1 Tax=Duganella aquatilis TaxID=2666082 RepID=A0A844D3D6_9BURK|nr:methyl-accepting chemotaxis protein [Duganella aquatilis]MRW82656.1 methyl-accepting chemotaxis protein [Duganella aquatilis]